ncbi:GCN5 family acetyltransferase [Heyndrickxia shackletonii]|uniref:GCN5 family acetyltransferase n=1 Tax=Heyndrickxia shackletonii TaxID=157838 RepID=A0A0Q3WX64_9BACI|nr:GNAT family N-acetyltransferase [Heyndrickxia shackletonii]KQL54031.1 GCN5 family acetyltransferase [Heyndrickxia shackletonii]NEZ02465.1 GNAT family N-acetyltransferase [Heyndrickxia shackletonii]
MNVIFQEDLSNVNWTEMKQVYQSVGWNKHTEEIIQSVFQASNVIVIVRDEMRIVGFGRALTDGVFNAAIYDVVVHKHFQGKGIAKQIIMHLTRRLEGVSCIHLISTTGNEAFYEKMGFQKLKTGMARYLNSSLAEEYLE